MGEPQARPDASQFGARLALVRHKMKWNVKEAALACGLPPATWRAWESTGALPRDYLGACRAIAQRANIDLDWLVYGPHPDSDVSSKNDSTNWYSFAHTA